MKFYTAWSLAIKRLLWVTVLLSARTGQGQSENVYNYSIAEGLPQSQVFAICQDSTGYLWAGTQGGGLAKFDGQKFEVFTESNGLSSNYISSLLTDHTGMIWIGTTKGVNYYTLDGIRKIVSPELTGLEITSLAEWADSILIGTPMGIFNYHKETKTLRKKVLRRNSQPGRINDIKVINGNLWMATEKGLWVQNDGASVPKKVDGLPYPNINAIQHDRNNSVWLSIYGYGLLSLDEHRLSKNNELTHALLGRTTCMLIDGGGHLWLGTENDGICTLDQTTGNISQLSEDAGLSTSKIRALMKDTWGNLWVGTSGAGLIKKSSQLFKHINLYDYEFGSNRVYAVSNSPAKNIYFAVSKDNVGFFDGRTFHQMDLDSLGIDVKIKSITADTTSRLWLGTEGKGLYCIGSKTALHFSTSDQTLTDDHIVHLVADEQNRIWVATQANGIQCLTITGDSIIKNVKITAQNGLADRYINCLARDKTHKRTWFGSRNSSVGYITNEMQITMFNGTNGIPAKSVKTMALDTIGQCFLGVEGHGVYSINPKSPSKTISYKRLWLPSKPYSTNIYSMIFDGVGYLWLGTENGVYKLEVDLNFNELKDVTWYGREDGFAGIENCHNSICLDNQNNIWFGTMNGLIQYNPSAKKSDQLPPKLFIREVLLFNKSVIKSPYAGCFNPSADRIDRDLPYHQNNLSFTYEAVHLNFPNKLQFRFKLAGGDDRWSEWSEDKRINFSGISPGNYCFMVQATFDKMHLSPVEQICFRIAAPYWQQNWFRLLMVLLSLSLIITIFIYREKRIKHKAEIKNRELKLQNKLLSLEQKSLQLQMNPHFIFNALNSIQSLVVTAHPDEARLQIQNFALLMRTILNNARKTAVSLKEEIDLLTRYLTMEQFCQQNKFKFNIDVYGNIDQEETFLPSMLIQPYVENAVIHGISHLHISGNIQVTFELQELLLKCTLTDNGVGRKRAGELSLNRKESHSSIGMQVTAQRLETLSVANHKSAVEIIDLFAEDGHAAGTRVILYIPIESTY
ncbi:MAG: histidine kinase [Saprospiraceae bacterium]|nr:histidine kinase [Saprospiraceae bacterium]